MSSVTADSKFERMLHEVHSQRGRAPTTGLPRSAREDEEEAVDFTQLSAPAVASARVAPAVSAREAAETVDDRETVRNILGAIEAVGGNLYEFTTPAQRADMRRATCPPRASLERTLQTNPASSLLTTSLLAVGVGVLLGSMFSASSGGYRGVAEAFKPSSTSARTVERMLAYA